MRMFFYLWKFKGFNVSIELWGEVNIKHYHNYILAREIWRNKLRTEHDDQSRRLNEQTPDESAKRILNGYRLRIIARAPEEYDY